MATRTSKRHADAEARQRAVTSYDRNLVIVAGAGTGKTSLLVERLLNQVLEQDLSLSDLAAITFTEKAALEMRDRFEAGLMRLAVLAHTTTASVLDETKEADRAFLHLSERLESSEIYKRARRARAELPRATISTIHSFCASLLRAHPVESRVDPSFSVDEGLTLAALLRELWQEFLEGERGPDGARRSAWSELLGALDLRELEALAFKLADFSVPFFPARQNSPDAAGPLAARSGELRGRIDSLLDPGREPKSGPESYLQVTRSLLDTLESSGLERLREALARGAYRSSRGLKSLLEGAPPTAKAQPEASECAKDARALLEAILLIDEELITRAIDLVTPFVVRARDEARRRGVLSFDALLCLARDLLAQHRSVRRKLAGQLRLVLVDEFQDTDPLQYEIILFLAEETMAPQSDDPFSTQLARGKLFIVGDPKQSIYHFRRADIAAYHQAVARVQACGGEQLALTTSWRAVPQLLEPLNPLFEALLVPKTDLDREVEPDFERMESGREAQADDPRVEVWTVGTASRAQTAEQARRAEGEVIADWIATEHAEGRQSYGEIALLFRALSQVHLYTRPLRERGIPFLHESRHGASEQCEGIELQALLRAIANPNDAPAVLAVLRSLLGATPDAELLRFSRSVETPWAYLSVTPDAQPFPNVARDYEFLRGWHGRSLSLPPHELLLRLIEETPLLALHAAAEDGLHRVTLLRALIDRLVEVARSNPGHSLGSLLPWLASENALPSASIETDQVRILSVHGAKGLEFPTVIVPDLGRKPGGEDRHGAHGVEIAWLPVSRNLAVSTDAGCSAIWPHHTWEEARHASAEHKRLFYVACTRARERLILVHAPRRERSRQRWISFLSIWGYPESGLGADETLGHPALRHRVLEPRAVASATESSRPTRDWVGRVQHTQAIAMQAAARGTPLVRSPSGLREEADAARDGDDAGEAFACGLAADLPRLVGLAVHEALERWNFRDPDQLAAKLATALGHISRDAPIDARALQQEAAKVIGGLLESELPAYLASREVLARELPVLFRDEEGRAWSGVLDLLYRDPDGRLVVADYKTDSDPSRETRQRYGKQLDLYARGLALAFLGTSTPLKELIYVRTGERVRIE